MNQVLKHHARNSGEFFKFLSLPFPSFRITLVISKKVIKHRVDRNRQKRRILHILKESIPTSRKIACVLWVKKDTSPLSHQELKEELLKLLQQSAIR